MLTTRPQRPQAVDCTSICSKNKDTDWLCGYSAADLLRLSHDAALSIRIGLKQTESALLVFGLV